MIFCDGSDEILTDEEREEIEAREAARVEEAQAEMLGLWPKWAADLYLEIESWVVTLPGWQGYLDFILSRPAANDVTAFSLDGPMWARCVLEAVAEAGA